MSDEQDKLKLSLEPPKLFGRKKKAANDAVTAAPEEPAPEAARPTTPAAEERVLEEPEADEPAREEPVVEEPVVEEPVVEEPVVEEPEADEPAPDEPTVVLESVETEPHAEEPEEPTAIQKTEAPEPEPEPEPAPTAKPAAPAKAAAAAPAVKPVKPVKPVKIEPVAATEDTEIASVAAHGPLLTIYRAAALTGFVVGASMVVLTWLSLRGCEAVRGTSSCGGGPGFLLLIATFALCVLLGSALLKAFLIPDPGSSSFLAVGLVAVVALLFLIDFLDNWAMLIVIPVLSIGGYLASVWVTKTFVEPVDT